MTELGDAEIIEQGIMVLADTRRPKPRGSIQAHRASALGPQRAAAALLGIRPQEERLWEWAACRSGNGNAPKMTKPLVFLAGAGGLEPPHGRIKRRIAEMKL